MEVRLAGIATIKMPGKAGGEESVNSLRPREYLADLILNEIVHIASYGSDIENRVVAELYLDGMNINLEMVRAGFAEVYSGGLHKDLDLERYRRAEQGARKAGLGMWASGDR